MLSNTVRRCRIKYNKCLLETFIVAFITSPPNGPVLFCSRASVVVVCRLSSPSVVVCNAAGGRAGRSPGVWTVDTPAAGRVDARVVDTARRASRITSR